MLGINTQSHLSTKPNTSFLHAINRERLAKTHTKQIREIDFKAWKLQTCKTQVLCALPLTLGFNGYPSCLLKASSGSGVPDD